MDLKIRTGTCIRARSAAQSADAIVLNEVLFIEKFLSMVKNEINDGDDR